MEKKREKAVKKEHVTEKKEKVKDLEEEVSTKKEVKERKTIPENKSDNRTERILIENFVSLQHVMTNLAVKFDNLSSQISKLLELFEISAKTLAEKESESKEGEENTEVIERLDNLIEQNKVLARGITLLHERDSEKQYPSVSNSPEPSIPAQNQKYPPYKNPKFGNMNG